VVGDGERVAVFVIAQQERSFVVGAPQLVGTLAYDPCHHILFTIAAYVGHGDSKSGGRQVVQNLGREVPLLLPSNIPTVPLSASATTKSRVPVPRKSAATTLSGEIPARGMMIGNCAVPSPLPRYNQRSLAPPLETTQSIVPS
jgi:hypothetical protein